MVTFHNRRHQPVPKYVPRAGRVDVDTLYAAQLQRMRMRLLVFKPGTTDPERTRVAIYSFLLYKHGIIAVAVAATLLMAYLVPESVDHRLFWVIGLGCAVAGGIALWSWLAAKSTLDAAHGVSMSARGHRTGPQIFGDLELLEVFAGRLEKLDSRGLSPVEHEIEWHKIYDELAAVATSSARELQD